MDLKVDGKTAVITGGASGLGAETARYLARDGANLVLADINQENLDKIAAEIREIGAKAETVKIDVRSHQDCERMAAAAKDAFGGIDILIASAGVSGPTGFFADTSPDDWERTLDINIKGVMNSNHACLPIMIDGGQGGSIVNLSSEAGRVGDKRMVVYGASKGAVLGFSKCLAVEVGAQGIRVNAICPGVTLTPMTAGLTPEMIEKWSKVYPMRRLGQPEDIAAAIAFLASGQSGWTTGQAISINGGFSRC